MPRAPTLPNRVLLPFFFVLQRPVFFWPTADTCVLRRPSWLPKDVILPPRADACGAWRPSFGRPLTRFGPSSRASGARRQLL